jgi:hypothetical protein
MVFDTKTYRIKVGNKNIEMLYLCCTQGIKKGFTFLRSLVFSSSGNWTRTSDLRVMSLDNMVTNRV